MAVKENVKVEEILDGEEFTTENENGGEEMTKKNINWKLYGKCVAGVLLVGVAGAMLYKWRKSKKAATVAVVTTPSNNSGANETVAPAATVVEI